MNSFYNLEKNKLTKQNQTGDDVSVNVVEEIYEEEDPYWHYLSHAHSVVAHHPVAHRVARWHAIVVVWFLISGLGYLGCCL